jgi:DNA polymerase
MRPDRAYGDVETFTGLPGEDPLDTHGAYRYSVDPTTGLNCGVLHLPGQPAPYTYEYGQHEQLAQMIRWVLENTNWIFVFHYALFELAIIQNKLGVVIPPNRVIDTFAKLAYYGYPRGLDQGAQALHCSTLKDLEGKGVMKELAKGLWTPAQKPAEFQRLYHYNRVDVQVTAEIDTMLPDMPPEIQALWELDVEINMRGLPIDLRAVNNAIGLKDYLKDLANGMIQAATAGYVQTVGQVEKIQEFAAAHGVAMIDCTADTVRRLLGGELPEVVRHVLEIRQEYGLSSVAKYVQAERRHVGGRLYHEFDTYGCISGRPKGRGFQALNPPRSTQADRYGRLLSEAPQFIPVVFTKPLVVVKEGVRGVIMASSNKVFVGGDLGQIEARNSGWAAGDLKFLDLFREGDPYCKYGRIKWGRVITKADLLERTASKADVLSLIFAGGIGAGQRGAEQYGVDLDMLSRLVLPTGTYAEMQKAEDCYLHYMSGHPMKPLTREQALTVDIQKQRFRADFPVLKEYWDLLMEAFIHGGWAKVVYFEVRRNLRVMTLPSGRQMFYHDCRFKSKKEIEEDGEVSRFGGQWTYQAREKRKKVWKGLLMENVAQAINHDISTWYMKQANENIGPVVHQCYDEFTLEVEKSKEDWAKEQLEKLVKTQPPWSTSPIVLPIAFDVWSGERYG